MFAFLSFISFTASSTSTKLADLPGRQPVSSGTLEPKSTPSSRAPRNPRRQAPLKTTCAAPTVTFDVASSPSAGSSLQKSPSSCSLDLQRISQASSPSTPPATSRAAVKAARRERRRRAALAAPSLGKLSAVLDATYAHNAAETAAIFVALRTDDSAPTTPVDMLCYRRKPVKASEIFCSEFGTVIPRLHRYASRSSSSQFDSSSASSYRSSSRSSILAYSPSSSPSSAYTPVVSSSSSISSRSSSRSSSPSGSVRISRASDIFPSHVWC